ncbi:DUF4238 domain-containing protein [Cupriavidus nantongensis]|uniref:DUF4238 domain-containing protein n=1 Tax=Cupriavidus nantongensis TaxID=1796606 RepID=UPI002245F398
MELYCTPAPQGASVTTNPPKGNDARNHHYVPQCYLKGFARNRSKNAQLFVVDTKTKRAFVTTPRNLAAQRDFNRVEIPGQATTQISWKLAMPT